MTANEWSLIGMLVSLAVTALAVLWLLRRRPRKRA